MGQLSADISSTKALYCLNRKLGLVHVVLYHCQIGNRSPPEKSLWNKKNLPEIFSHFVILTSAERIVVQGIFTALLINTDIHCILLRNIVGLQYFDSSGKKHWLWQPSRAESANLLFNSWILFLRDTLKKSSCSWHQEIINSKIDT